MNYEAMRRALEAGRVHVPAEPEDSDLPELLDRLHDKIRIQFLINTRCHVDGTFTVADFVAQMYASRIVARAVEGMQREIDAFQLFNVH